MSLLLSMGPLPLPSRSQNTLNLPFSLMLQIPFYSHSLADWGSYSCLPKSYVGRKFSSKKDRARMRLRHNVLCNFTPVFTPEVDNAVTLLGSLSNEQ